MMIPEISMSDLQPVLLKKTIQWVIRVILVQGVIQHVALSFGSVFTHYFLSRSGAPCHSSYFLSLQSNV